MLMEIVGTLATALTGGGFFGGLASLLSGWVKNRSLEKQREHEIRLLEMQTDAKRWEMVQVMQAEGQKADAQFRTASMNWSPSVKGASQWVVDCRAMFRPVLTIVLIALAVGLVFYTDIPKLVEYGITGIVFAASTAAMWWFGERAISLPAGKR